MDELEISGKRYVSSRRAAKEHGYHADYISQLARSGKVAGSKVGRAWYVEEESLAVYLGKETAPPAPVLKAPMPEVEENREEEAAEPKEIRLKVIEEDYSHAETEEEKFASHDNPGQESDEKPASKSLTYIADTEPLFPEIRKARIAAAAYIPEMAHAHSTPAVTRRGGGRLIAAAALVVLGGALFATAALSSILVNATITVRQGEPASAGFSLR